jgi:hypothetical protein
MIISHTHKYIFIKSEKTAGTSVEAALSNYCSANDVVTPLGDYWFNRDEKGEWVHSSMNPEGFFQHDPAVEIKRKVSSEVWSEYFKFSITRNPWDRIVSLFSWEARNRPELKPQRTLLHTLGMPFDEFGAITARFREFVNSEWKTNDRFYVLEGQCCVDFVIRYEHLADDLAEVCRTVGLPAITLPRLKAGLRGSKHHYSEYYDEASKQLVGARHANDLRLFGYKFESAA